MSGNTFGRLFRLTTYGESHGPALGGVVDGCPAGIALSEELLQKELDRRRPGGGTAGTTRKEPDAVRLLSGVFEGATTGTPIGFQIENTNQRSGDYGPLAAVWRPGHADMTYDAKYGVRDFRGGGPLVWPAGPLPARCSRRRGFRCVPARWKSAVCPPRLLRRKTWRARRPVRTALRVRPPWNRGRRWSVPYAARATRSAASSGWRCSACPPVWANPCSISWMPCWRRRS